MDRRLPRSPVLVCQLYLRTLLEAFKELKRKGVALCDTYILDQEGNNKIPELAINEFVLLRADQSVKKTQLGRFDGQKIVPLNYKKARPYGVTPRNAGQYFLQEALMEDAEKVPLVIVKGMAGTAKTFYAIAVGLEKTLNSTRAEYRKILITRPNVQFDADIGFLPGSEQDKISPLIRPVIDNLEQLIDSNE